MKKQLLLGLVMVASSMLPTSLFAQSTQGTDFWVTLMRGDEKKYDELSLTFSANKATKVYIENTFAGTEYYDTVEVGDNAIERLVLNDHVSSCYVTNEDEETPANRALHVTSDLPISLIAANYKDKSFDVAAILPTPALMSDYRIQCYKPYAHKDPQQGSHFAIVAADDNVVVEITPSVSTANGKAAGTMFTTDTLKRGQVYYVWTGEGQGDDYDFTGTIVKARNNKKIAVFNGNSHTNIPSKEDRDHIYSQAMPTAYWGKRFAITSSLTTIDNQKDKIKDGNPNPEYKKLDGYWERIDKIRVQALVDGTVVKVDDTPVYTFNFATNPKHYFEFDFGEKDDMTSYSGTEGIPYYKGSSHYIETSCPSAVHLFMTSNRYDHGTKKIDGTEYKYCNGDPSEIWVNPIEQKIDTLTFGTFQTKQVEDHFLNIVTLKENVKSVILDGDSIYNKFADLNGNSEYVYARLTGLPNGTHTLTADSGFIAHVYGFGQRESYGYPAGGRTMDLTAFVIINGETYRPDNDNLICGDDKVTFGCELNYEYDSIYWYFGDGKDSLIRMEIDSIEHLYEHADTYKAYVVIYRHLGDDDGCTNYSANDTIKFHVNIGNFKVDIKKQKMPECTKQGDEVDFLIYLDNPAGVSLTSDSVKFSFTKAALDDGFKLSDVKVQGDTMLIVHLPATAKDKTPYGLHLHIGSQCPNSVLDKDLEFQLKFDIPLLGQRYNNVLGLIRDSIPASYELSNFQWYHDGELIPDEKSAVLVLEENESNNGEYKLCYTIHEDGQEDYTHCTCPVTFKAPEQYKFDENPDSTSITTTYAIRGDKVFVNADYKGQKDVECYAQWITVSGKPYNGEKFTIPDGGCTIKAPAENGFYILRVVTGKEKRSFKMIVNK